jgi:phosphatidylserine/phosphatidylglycerophosphate/cardiolipin synthase-like enzyme
MNTIQQEILTDLRSAKRSIKVAVSWLTDTLLINELIFAKKKGIDVKLILSSNELNIIRFELFQQLIDLKADVLKWGNEEPEQGKFMHYKFYIIDDKIAKSGSYNWSINATTNKEALDEVAVNKKLQEFELCFKESVNFFFEIENPEKKRAELQKIEKEQKDILTPEKLAAYRQIQQAIKISEEKHKKEIEENIRKQKELDQKLAKEKAENERLEQEKKKRETQNQYEKKEQTPTSQVPPTSYAL